MLTVTRISFIYLD